MLKSHVPFLIREGLAVSGMETQMMHNSSEIIKVVIVATHNGRRRKAKSGFEIGF